MFHLQSRTMKFVFVALQILTIVATAQDTPMSSPIPSPSPSIVPAPTPSPGLNPVVSPIPVISPAPSSDNSFDGSGSSNSPVKKTTSPAPSSTVSKQPTKTSLRAATETPTTPPVPTVNPLEGDKQNSEYGTSKPIVRPDDSQTKDDNSSGSSTGAWLVPAVIGAVVVSVVMFIMIYARKKNSKREDEYDDYGRDTDFFFEHPRTSMTKPSDFGRSTLDYEPQQNKAGRNDSMRTHAVGGGMHSPPRNLVPSTGSRTNSMRKITSPTSSTKSRTPPAAQTSLVIADPPTQQGPIDPGVTL